MNEFNPHQYLRGLSPQALESFKEKNGTIGDGKPGNGVLLPNGKIQLRDVDLAWIYRSGSEDTFGNEDSIKAVKEVADNGDSVEIEEEAFVLRGVPAGAKTADEMERGRTIYLKGVAEVSETTDDEKYISDVDFDEKAIKSEFENRGIEMNSGTALVLSILAGDKWEEEVPSRSASLRRRTWGRFGTDRF